MAPRSSETFKGWDLDDIAQIRRLAIALRFVNGRGEEMAEMLRNGAELAFLEDVQVNGVRYIVRNMDRNPVLAFFVNRFVNTALDHDGNPEPDYISLAVELENFVRRGIFVAGSADYDRANGAMISYTLPPRGQGDSVGGTGAVSNNSSHVSSPPPLNHLITLSLLLNARLSQLRHQHQLTLDRADRISTYKPNLGSGH